MAYHINDDGQLMTEDVSLIYEDNYIKITTPPMDAKTHATIIHHTTEVKLCILT